MEEENLWSCTYAPIGASHELQQLITSGMSEIVQADGRFTLAELGYLHMNTLTYSKKTGEVKLRIYFDARLASRLVTDPVNGSSTPAPVQELMVFSNRFYAGDQIPVSFDTIPVKKFCIVTDEVGRQAVKVLDSPKTIDTYVLILDCNLALTMASCLGIDLKDPNFKVSVSTVGKGAKSDRKQLIESSWQDEVPVSVTVQCTEINRVYNPDNAIPYLQKCMEEAKTTLANREKLKDKVKGKAEKKAKKIQKESVPKGFSKYS